MKMKRIRQRNPFHDHPLMRKGGVHEKSEREKRHVAKQQLKNSEWYKQSNKKYFVYTIHKRTGSLIGKALDCRSIRCGFNSRPVRQI